MMAQMGSADVRMDLKRSTLNGDGQFDQTSSQSVGYPPCWTDVCAPKQVRTMSGKFWGGWQGSAGRSYETTSTSMASATRRPERIDRRQDLRPSVVLDAPSSRVPPENQPPSDVLPRPYGIEPSKVEKEKLKLPFQKQLAETRERGLT